MLTSRFHTPVMLKEILEYLKLCPGKIIVDATIGTGGHSLEIIKHIIPGGRIIGIDRDSESLEMARMRLKEFAPNCDFVHGNFSKIDVILKDLGIMKVDGVLFDLGLSSFQLENAERGFSFQRDGPLDMRLDRMSYISAYDLINNLNEEEISSILWNFGQERWHNRIAHLLIKERERHPISTTKELTEIVLNAIPLRYRHRCYRIHPATRTFQAIRIAVNRELETLEVAIDKAQEVLNPSGRICVISFHSLEDRIVKLAFKRMRAQNLIKIITPKPLVPRAEEMETNPSSRSSKLRVAEKI
ncbi:MAG: 16S rRNA (cytosine(1402)-N(4))-methyltransferase RsmH [Candidatus Omnitrophica bacterium]|nr:16S rRNA (cytosine(1402)-N(4))-methyltransferase RsmH [Candidatus Omnitrophota bacterium]